MHATCELTAEAHAQVRASPKQVRQLPARGKVAGPPADVSHSLLGANVRQATIVRILERTHLFHSP